MTKEQTIEAMARAMAEADGKDPDAPAWVSMGARAFGVCWRDQYLEKATAAYTVAQECIERLEAALSDALAFIRGDISGPAQREGILADGAAALTAMPATGMVTGAMVEAGREAALAHYRSAPISDEAYRAIFRAMIAAAPGSELKEEGGV